MLSSLLHGFRQTGPVFTMAEGIRAYAIGDVHGCLEQLNQLLDAIADDVSDCTLETHLIFLGDLIDRGPQSADVIEQLRTRRLPTDECHFILGNHEEILLACYAGASEHYGSWLKYGGLETLESYGISRAALSDDAVDLAGAMRAAIPPTHIAFLKSFKDYVELGDYLFVHAGIQPGVPISAQLGRDLRWIRRGFLDRTEDHGRMVVHGHTIVPEVEFHRNRIAVDTGCYQTGKLSAVRFEGDSIKVITS